MLKLYVWFKELLRNERGQDVIEYGLISALISIAIIGVVLATGLVDTFGDWAEAVGSAMSGASL